MLVEPVLRIFFECAPNPRLHLSVIEPVGIPLFIAIDTNRSRVKALFLDAPAYRSISPQRQGFGFTAVISGR